jgi:hypothetical protein
MFTGKARMRQLFDLRCAHATTSATLVECHALGIGIQQSLFQQARRPSVHALTGDNLRFSQLMQSGTTRASSPAPLSTEVAHRNAHKDTG